jgi:S-DNA-T family DNA segregation ATPase FtsK/SpoIIIE
MAPEPVTGRLVLAAPPRPEPREGLSGLLVMAIPMLGSLGSIVVVTTMSGAHTDGRQYVAAGMFVLATLGFVIVQADRQRTQRQDRTGGSRAAYARHLSTARAAVREAAREQQRHLRWHHPDPSALPAWAAEGTRVWERGPADPLFLQVRCGLAEQPLDLELVPPEASATDQADPAAVAALDRLLTVHRVVPGCPVTIDLRCVPRLALGRDTALARAVVCSAAATHAPDHLAVAVLATPERLAHWDWLKWLPHSLSPVRADAVGPARMVATSIDELAPLVPDGPHLLLVLDGVELSSYDARPRTTVLDLAGEVDLACQPDRCSLTVAEAFTRRLTTRSAGSGDEVDIEPSWAPRSARDLLRVPIGTTDGGEPLELDLKESAQQGVGPHGLVVGATGSGKSELLRTLVLRLALTHSPEQLNLVLVDFKGGATFAGLGPLPHVSALITNLADELALVERMQDALSGEVVRRQELLRAAGNLASVREYDAARAGGADLAPLPSLLIVVDEFAELLSAQPEFVDLFVAVGRLGRSLGLHLLLASQRLEEGRLRGLESHLSYRIGLRTFSAQESRTVLGVPDAYELPAVPGLGYLRTDQATLVRFAASYVSGPRAPRSVATGERVLPFSVAEVRPTDVEDVAPAEAGSVLDLAVRRMVGRGAAAHRIWLPPLDEPERLEELVRERRGPLVVPVGTVDRPREQRRDPLVLDLTGSAGHVAVVGGPRSGKSTLVQTIVASVATGSTPLEAQVFLLDLGGGLAPVAALPHVSGVATRADLDLVRRIVAEVQGLVDRREASGRHGDLYGEVFLVVDGWSTLRSDFDDLEAVVQQVAVRGLAHGVHVVATATRWSDFRPTMRDLFGTRLELRLGDPVDSEIDRRAASSVPVDRPGRGLVDGLHFLSALPDVRSSWTGPVGPRLRMLPTHVTLGDVDAPRGGLLRLGLAERDLRPVAIDAGEPHLLVLGDRGSGKSSVLRLLAHEVVRTRTPADAQILLVDPRRSIGGFVPDAYLLDDLDGVVAHLRGRAPGWAGPDVFVLVDDHDLVAPSLHPLVPLLPVARDVGLHLVVARRSGGAARAMFEPVLQTMRDLGAPGLLLAGSPDEGPLLGGVRPAPAPPGRGRLVSRDRGVEVVQVAWVQPSDH